MPPMGTADYPSETESNDITAIADPLVSGTKGFTGSIYPQGDIDVYEVDVANAGSDMTVRISNGMGGCPPGLGVTVRADGPNGLLGSDNGACPVLSPVTHPDMANLPAGKHYVQVESDSFSIEDFYVVEITLQAPACGNGVTQGVEQCDDGNMVAGDGCAPDCKLEGNFLSEMEPNQPIGSANSLNGADGIFASIQPVGDQDFFSFDITVPGSFVTLEVSDGFMGCPTGFDSVLYLYGPNGMLLTSDDESGVDSCSLISPANKVEATNLPVGKYTAMVEEYLNNGAQASYVLKIKVVAPGCGDTFVQAGEECDDGNTTSGDGCSATCKLEGNYTPEVEPNDNANSATTVNGFDGAFGAITPAGDQDYFTFDVTVPGSSVRIETTNGYGGCPSGFDSVITLYSGNNQVVVSDDEDGIDSCSLISPQLDVEATNLSTGKYRIRVEEYLNDGVQPSYVLKVKVSAPGCGDSIRTDPEQCDDGNTTSGDGCDATCMAESPWEVESNNTQMTATPLWAGTNKFYGSILPATDADYFSFTLPAGKKPLLETHNIGSNASCDYDTEITLFDSNGMTVVTDDDSGTNSCSRINSTDYPAVNNLSAGTYYVKVNEYLNDGKIASYQLDVIFQ
jgi:cysteine-rich repeat protein